MSTRKKSGKKVSGDPRKRAVTAVKKTRVERTLRLHEFIDMENPRDVENLRAEAIEEKSIDLGDEFFDWYLDKTGAKPENVSGISLATLPFFDALLDFGKTAPDTGQLNFDDIVTYLKDPANTPPHMAPSWNDDTEKYLLSYLKDFLQVKGYLDDVPDLLRLDAYKEKVLDFEYSFYGDEPAVFSFTDK